MRQLVIALLIVFSSLVPAEELIKFENGQVADAEDVNANFQALSERLMSLETRLVSLEPNGSCLALSGQDSGIIVGESRDLMDVDTDVTISGWIKVEGDCLACPVFSSEMANSGTDADNTGYGLYVLPGGVLRGYIGTGENIVSKNSFSEGFVIPKNQWTHVAMVRNLGLLKLFIDGAVNSEFVVGPESISFDGLFMEHNFTNIGGGYANGFDGGQPRLIDRFLGTLSQIGVWNRPLLDSEISAMADQEFDYEGSNPAGFWPLDEGQGGTVKDSSVFSNDGVLPASASWSTSCK